MRERAVSAFCGATGLQAIGLTFPEAFAAMEEGFMARRPCWAPNVVGLRMCRKQDGFSRPFMCLVCLNDGLERRKAWVPYGDDFAGKDWTTFKEEQQDGNATTQGS